MLERRFVFLQNGVETVEPLQKLAEGKFDTLLDDFEINGNLQCEKKRDGNIEIVAKNKKGIDILHNLKPTRSDDLEIRSSQISGYEGFVLGIVSFYEKQGENGDEAILKAIQIAAIYLKENGGGALDQIPENSVFRIRVFENSIEIGFESLNNPVYVEARKSRSELFGDLEKQKLEDQKTDYSYMLGELLSKLYDVEDDLTHDQQQQCEHFSSQITELRAEITRDIGSEKEEISMDDLRKSLEKSKVLYNQANEYFGFNLPAII